MYVSKWVALLSLLVVNSKVYGLGLGLGEADFVGDSSWAGTTIADSVHKIIRILKMCLPSFPVVEVESTVEDFRFADFK